MLASSVRARSLLLASMVSALLLVVGGTASADAEASLAPSETVTAIPAEKFHAGQQVPLGTFVPIGTADAPGAGTTSSQSQAGAPLGPSSLPGSGPPVLINKPGLTVNDNGKIAPDSTGGIGPKHYIEMVNDTIAVYDRDNLSLISSAPTDTEFQPGGYFVDPQIQWDEQAQRWFYLAIGPRDQSANNNFTLAFGWSKTTDPTDVNPGDGTIGWCRYLVPTTTMADALGFFDDYPKLGHDDNHLVFGSNVYRFGGLGTPALRGARIWSVPKPAVGSTTCPSAPVASVFGDPLNNSPLRTADGDNAFTPVPAKTIESTDKTYVVAADNPDTGATSSQIMAWHVTGTATSPTLVEDGNMDVPSYGQPQQVPQPGTLDPIDLPANGARLTASVEDTDPDAGSAKAVWTQHTVNGTGGRSEMRWYELLPATRTVRQQGSVSSSLHSVFNGAVSPTKNGNEAAAFYNLASGTQVPQIGARSRRSDTPLGEMSGETIIGTSDDPLECGGTTDVDPCRWGDYSAASPDPRNAHAVWGTNELAGPRSPTTSYNWKTRNFAVSVRRPRLATFEDGMIVHPTTGFDTAVGQFEIKGTDWSPAPYEGSKELREIYFQSTGPAQGRYSETLPDSSDVWYGTALYLDNGFKTNNGNIALIEWSDPVSNVHGGVSLRTDDQYHVVRGTIANPDVDTNVGPAFSLPESKWFWLEVHQRLDTASPLTEVFLDGRLVSTSAQQNSYPDSFGIPSRVSFGIGTTQANALQVHLDRASLDVRQLGPLGAPATPDGFTGSGQDRTAIIYWNPSVGAAGYRVYKQAADGTWVQRFDTTTTGVFEPGLTNCTTYRYRVAAYNSAGLESVVSEPLSITPKAPNQQC